MAESKAETPSPMSIGADAAYVDQLFAKWRDAPQSVPESWQHFFAGMTFFEQQHCNDDCVLARKLAAKSARKQSKASVHALQAVPQLNARIEGNEIMQNHFYDIGIAVGTPRGLVVPVLRDCDQLDFGQIETQLVDLAKRAETSQLELSELGCRVEGADATKTGLAVRYMDGSGQGAQCEAERVLVGVGRRAKTDGIGLEDVGVATEGGKVVVDAQYRTNVPSVFAIGDLIGGPMLAHKAEEEGVAVAEIIAGKPGHVNYGAIPNVVYTWPELADVGLSEQQAKEQGHAVAVGRYKFAPNGRAKTLGNTQGMVKLVADKSTDRLLGAHIVGPRASDMIAELVLALEFSASAEDIARTSHAHPTPAEIVKEAALAVDQRMIHG